MSDIHTTKLEEQPAQATREVALDIDLEIAWRKQEITMLQGEVRAYETLKRLQAKGTIVLPAQPAPATPNPE